MMFLYDNKGNQKGLCVAKGHSDFWIRALGISVPACPAAL